MATPNLTGFEEINLATPNLTGFEEINLAEREKFAIANFTRFTNLTGLEEGSDTTVPII
ncbi:MAG: hypothetical protein HFJ19_00405 [Clostridia bacterium]|nr:hypothetical protein [Clostridia bacterium]